MPRCSPPRTQLDGFSRGPYLSPATAASCVESDEEPNYYSQRTYRYTLAEHTPEFSSPIRIHENFEAQHLVNAMAGGTT